MNALREWLRRVGFLINRRRRERELRREIDAHRAELGDAAAFGNALRLREDAVDVWGWRWIDDAARDARWAARSLRRRPGFTAVVVASLALVTGATTAIFAIVQAILIRPLPFDRPGELVAIYGRAWREDRPGPADRIEDPIGSIEFETYRDASTTIADLAAYYTTTAVLSGAGAPERLTAVVADLSLFDVLGAEPLVGRTFRPGEGVDVAVLSEAAWTRIWQRDPTVIGRSVRLGDRAVTVLGVMPDRFQFPYRATSVMQSSLPESRTDVWRPINPVRDASGALRRGRTAVIARLRPGITVEGATSELRSLAARLSAAEGGNVRYDARVVGLPEVVVSGVRRTLWVLVAAVALVVFAACANVANLLLAQMTVRVREVVTQAALGAGRGRIVRQCLAESLLLGLAGGLAGAIVAPPITSALVSLGAAYLPRAHEVALDWIVFTFLFAVCVVASMLFGLAPALAASRVDVVALTKSGVQQTAGRRLARLRDGLAVIEVAAAAVLALGASFVIREAARLEQMPAGMTTSGVLTLHVTPTTTAATYQAIVDRVAALPGVRSAAVTQMVPLQNWGWEGEFRVRGRDTRERLVSELRYVSPEYFRTLDIPITRGRGFTAQDASGAGRVIVVNETLAQRYFAGEDPIGVETDRGTIVGVAGDVRQVTLAQSAVPEIYYPIAQNVTAASDIGMSLVVRSDGDPTTLTRPLRAAIAEVAPALAVFNVRTMEEIRRDSMTEVRLYRWAIGLFASLALSLAAIGLAGIISFYVTARQREFAVRLALGADPLALIRLVMTRALRLVAVGLAGGGVAALLLAPIAMALPGAAAALADPLNYAIVAAAIAMIAGIACLAPAARLVRLDPNRALRVE